MAFTIRNDVHVEELGDAYLVLVPDDERVYQLEGDQAEAFALARDGAKSVPEHLTTAMAGLVELGLVETKDWSRRKVLQMGGAAAAAAVVMLNMPSVAAAGSATTIAYLITGGGGGGGAGGGGAGEYLEGTTAAATNLTGNYTVSVGAGGLPSMYHLSFAGINQDLPNTGTNGGPSSITGPAAFGTKSTKGGGGGGSAVSDTSNLFGTKLNPGSAGGSGGGGGVNTNPLGTPSPAQAAAGAATNTPPGKGSGGGLGGSGNATTTYNGTGGGGGGATAAGKNFVLFTAAPAAPVSAPSTTVSSGGAGIVSPIATAWSNNQPTEVIPPPNTVGQTTPYVPKRPTPTLYVGEQSGSSWYVTGGGGGSGIWMAGKGGLGGGGDGSATGNPTATPPVPPLYAPWVDGTQNTGGGAAGGGTGSNGVVIVAVTPYDKVTVPAATGVTKVQVGSTMYVLFTNTAVPPVPPPVVPPSPVTTPVNQSYTFTITT